MDSKILAIVSYNAILGSLARVGIDEGVALVREAVRMPTNFNSERFLQSKSGQCSLRYNLLQSVSFIGSLELCSDTILSRYVCIMS